MAEIDNSSIEYLALIVNIARRIAGMADDASATSELSHDFQPSFLWLIRDFALRAEDKDGRPMTAKQYMESQLAPRRTYLVPPLAASVLLRVATVRARTRMVSWVRRC